MRKIKVLSVLIFLVALSLNAQLNDYKYIVIPKKFKEFKNENQYQTSTLLKYLFVEASYSAIYEDVLPNDLKENGCLALKADLENKSSLFTTKVKIIVKDCNGQVVFTSIEGRSKQKDYKTAYSEAIRKAFVSFESLSYSYEAKESEKEQPIVVSFKNDIKSLDQEVNEKQISKKIEDVAVAQEASIENQSFKSLEPVTSAYKRDKKTSKISENKLEVLYAQATENGFQLVDSTPKIQYKLIETSIENVFLANHGDKNGVVLNKNGKWFFEYNEGGEQILKELNIKF